MRASDRRAVTGGVAAASGGDGCVGDEAADSLVILVHVLVAVFDPFGDVGVGIADDVEGVEEPGTVCAGSVG